MPIVSYCQKRFFNPCICICKHLNANREIFCHRPYQSECHINVLNVKVVSVVAIFNQEPGEGPGWGLVRDCTTSNVAKVQALLIRDNQTLFYTECSAAQHLVSEVKQLISITGNNAWQLKFKYRLKYVIYVYIESYL